MFWRRSPEDALRRARFADWFAHLDVDRDGQLDGSDFVAWVDALAQHLRARGAEVDTTAMKASSEDVWRELSRSMDEDGDGSVSRNEFVGFYVSLSADLRAGKAIPTWAASQVAAIFRALDLDGDGFITVDEYAAWLAAIGSSADPEAAFTVLDVNGDGRIDLEEVGELFHQWVESGSAHAPGVLLFTGRQPPA